MTYEGVRLKTPFEVNEQNKSKTENVDSITEFTCVKCGNILELDEDCKFCGQKYNWN